VCGEWSQCRLTCCGKKRKNGKKKEKEKEKTENKNTIAKSRD
jgi:hypothetical protein